MRAYYWRWIKTAFWHHSLGRAEAAATAITFWIAPAVKHMFDLDISGGVLLWRIAGAIAIAIASARIILAPYW